MTCSKTLFELALFTQADGALTQLFLAVKDPLELLSGEYYIPVGVPGTLKHPQARNLTLQKVLWQRTADTIRGLGFDLP